MQAEDGLDTEACLPGRRGPARAPRVPGISRWERGGWRRSPLPPAGRCTRSIGSRGPSRGRTPSSRRPAPPRPGWVRGWPGGPRPRCGSGRRGWAGPGGRRSGAATGYRPIDGALAGGRRGSAGWSRTRPARRGRRAREASGRHGFSWAMTHLPGASPVCQPNRASSRTNWKTLAVRFLLGQSHTAKPLPHTLRVTRRPGERHSHVQVRCHPRAHRLRRASANPADTPRYAPPCAGRTIGPLPELAQAVGAGGASRPVAAHGAAHRRSTASE